MMKTTKGLPDTCQAVTVHVSDRGDVSEIVSAGVHVCVAIEIILFQIADRTATGYGAVTLCLLQHRKTQVTPVSAIDRVVSCIDA